MTARQGRALWLAAWAPGALLALGLAVDAGRDPVRVWGNLLIVAFYFLTLALGALFFVALQHLVAAGWWTTIRRIPEALAGTLPIMAIPMVALYFGRSSLHHRSHQDPAHHDSILAAKAGFLDTPFFFGRMVLVLSLWALFSWLLLRARSSEAADDAEGRRRTLRRAAVFVPLFAVTFSLASFDWLMSLEPHWFSTIFAVYAFAGLFQAAIAATILGVVWLRPRLDRHLRRAHLHDLGKLLFAFSTFWAYIWFSQYLLIWYGHLPEEITHYVARTRGPWAPWFWANLTLNWTLPFLALLPRAVKRSWRLLALVAGMVLIGRWVDLYLHVMPALGLPPRLGWVELLVFTSFLGLFLILVRKRLDRGPLVRLDDPFLSESLSYRS